MVKRSIPIRVYIIAIIILLSMIALYLGNLAYVRNHPGGLDFLAHWKGTQLLLENGSNPYSNQTADQIRTAYSELAPGNTENYRFVLPFFSIIFLVPFSLFPEYIVARALWMTFLEVLLLLGGYLIAGWMSRKHTITITIVAMAVMLLNYIAVQAILEGSMVIISMILIILAISFILRKQDEAAGLVMAFSLVKPDLVYPIIAILLVWALIQKRFTVFWWFLVTFILTVGFSMVIIPSWPIDYLRSLGEFSARNPISLSNYEPTALQARFLIFKNLIILALIIFEWFLVRIHGTRRFLWLCGMLFSLTAWVGGSTVITNTIFIIPSILIGIGFLLELLKDKAYPWLLAVSLLLGLSGWLFSGTVTAVTPQSWLNTWMGIILPLIVMMVLYWSRWWVIRKEKFSDNYFGV